MSSFRAVAVLSVLALGVGLYFSIADFNASKVRLSPEKIEGFFWPNQKKLEPFAMVDSNGSPFTLAQLKGKWSFLFFGYTHCPDICPMTMQIMRQSRMELVKSNPDFASKINMTFVSVDGERDTPEHLKNYLSFFGGGFTGATGSEAQLQTLTGQMGVPYSIEPHQPEEKNYLVEHSGAVFLISPEGMLASIYQPPITSELIVNRFLQIDQFMNQ